MEIRLQKNYRIAPCEPSNRELALAKSHGKSDGEGETAKRGWFDGFISVEMMDSDGDLARAHGGELEMFLRKGFYVYEHPTRAHNIVGRPVSAEVDTEPHSGCLGVRGRGFYYLDDKMAKQLYEKTVLLAENEADDPLRWMGVSTEGKGWNVTDLPGGRYDIRKWNIHTAAITHRPKVEMARIAPDVMDIAASLTEIEDEGKLDNYLSTLLENRRLLRELSLEPSENEYVKYAMEKHGLTLSAARSVVELTQRLLA